MTYSMVKIDLPSSDDLFLSHDEQDDVQKENVEEIWLLKIDDFPNHPFHVFEDVELSRLVGSIRQHGVLNPVMVRPKENGRYEMVSGHRRKRACELLGLDTLPCLVRDMSTDEAIVNMVDSNLHREHILPSEKAIAYKMKLDAIRRQAGRPTRDNSRQVVGNYESADIVGKDTGESGRQIQRYIRLTELIPELLSMVDTKKIAFNPAVELSYLPHELQREFYDIIEANECTPSLSQAQRLKSAAQEERLDRHGIALVMSEEKAQQKESFSFSAEQSRRFFPPGYTPVQKQQHIERALHFFNRYLERKRTEMER